MSVIDQIIGAESGGDPNAKNPRSSATGAGQFLSSTWLETLSRHRPDLVQGRSQDEILALRNDPALSKEMTAAYAGDNAAILTQKGLPVTPGTTYLTHFAGPQGAVGILSADPSMPVGSILSTEAMKANPFLAGMTAGDLRGWADSKMGGSAPQASPAVNPQAAPLSMGGFGQAAPQAAPESPMGIPQPGPMNAFLAGLMKPAAEPDFMAPPPMPPPMRPQINLAQRGRLAPFSLRA